MTILDDILERKRGEVAEARRRRPASEMARLAEARPEVERRGFREALRSSAPPRVVAEIKRRSPSGGEIRSDFDPVACAKAYRDSGAAAISVLTDEHDFGGHLRHLEQVRRTVSLPLLRKEFIVDAYQVDEARAFGADAVLLIVAACSAQELRDLREHAVERGLDVLVEVHDASQLETALRCGADLIGINNRDLRTLETDLSVTERLAPEVPPEVVCVAESGIACAADLDRLGQAGAHAFLIGETLMRQPDPGKALLELRGTV